MIDYCLQEWVTTGSEKILTYLDGFWNMFENVK